MLIAKSCHLTAHKLRVAGNQLCRPGVWQGVEFGFASAGQRKQMHMQTVQGSSASLLLPVSTYMMVPRPPDFRVSLHAPAQPFSHNQFFGVFHQHGSWTDSVETTLETHSS
jgi:hypothetical protein